MARKAFNFYRSYYEIAAELPEKERGEFLWAIMQRQFEGIEPNLKGMAKFAYISQKHSIDAQVKGYQDKTGIKLTPTEGGALGGTEGGNQAPIKAPSVQEKEKEKEKEQDVRRKRFIPPTTEELKAYITQKQLNVNAESFISHYESNGWKVGKNKMKDWQAAARGWSSRNKEQNKSQTQQTNIYYD